MKTTIIKRRITLRTKTMKGYRKYLALIKWTLMVNPHCTETTKIQLYIYPNELFGLAVGEGAPRNAAG
jgi:hypothetical protein